MLEPIAGYLGIYLNDGILMTDKNGRLPVGETLEKIFAKMEEMAKVEGGLDEYDYIRIVDLDTAEIVKSMDAYTDELWEDGDRG